MNEPLLFAPQASRAFGERVAAELGLALSPMEEREFEGGEHKTRPLVSVRGRHVYVLQSLSGDAAGSANDRLCRLLFFIAGLKDSGASKVTACLPYLAYARKDRRTKERDPVTLKYVAQLIEAVGTDHVIGLDAHNLAAFESAFRCPVDHLEAAPLLATHLAAGTGERSVCIVSPDIGGAKRAQRVQEILESRTGREVGFALIEKRRSSGVVSGGEQVIGPVAGARAVIVDDLISAGTTLMRGVKACRAAGAAEVDAFATHGVLLPESRQLLGPDGPDRLIVTDSILPTRIGGEGGRSPVVLAVSKLFAEAIRRISTGGSVVALRELQPTKK
ncbi:MAG: ribose-phosphate pyrophosphokinase [Gammaproteobacteria bacterium]|nr:ribose-phosphate pyrophosphokinase [Gammaproteobacteria bacterium]